MIHPATPPYQKKKQKKTGRTEGQPILDVSLLTEFVVFSRHDVGGESRRDVQEVERLEVNERRTAMISVRVCVCVCAGVRQANERRDAEPNLAAKVGSSALFTHNDPLKRLLLREP